MLPVLNESMPIDTVERGSAAHNANPQAAACELARRKRISGYKVYLKLIVNGNYVERTKTSAMNDDFTLQLGEVFTCWLTRYPDELRLEVWHAGLVFDEHIANVPVGVPVGSGNISPHTQADACDFTSNEPFPVNNDPKRHVRFTSGRVIVRAGWVHSGSTQAHATPGPNPSDAAVRHAAARASAKLRDLIAVNKLDPNDPRNAELLVLLRQSERTSEHDDGWFRVDVDSADLLPAPMLGMAHTSNRLKLLRLRADGLIRSTEAIGLREAELDERFRLWQREAGDAADDLMLSKPNPAAGAVKRRAELGLSHKEKVLGLMRRLDQKQRQTTQLPRLHYSQVVREVSFPQFSFSLVAFKGLLEPRSKLKPKRTDRTTRASQMRKYNLIVQVRTITNLPVRVALPSGDAPKSTSPPKKPAAAAATDADDGSAGETATFVEVSFQSGTQVRRPPINAERVS